MDVTVRNTKTEDIDRVFQLYDDAIAYQKTVGNNHWLGFERELITREIGEKRHFVISFAELIAATFCITLSDPLIWTDSGNVRAVYIHRIATSNAFRGQKLLSHILSWAKGFAKMHDLSYIRLDTGGGNQPLIDYYIRNGFTFLGETPVNYTPDLPAHYKDGSFALFQMPVEKQL